MFRPMLSNVAFKWIWILSQLKWRKMQYNRNTYFNNIMAAMRRRCGHSILPLWFLLSSFFLFIAYTQPSQIGYLPYFHTWCGLSANLECTSEMCCTWLAENRPTGRKNRLKFAIWPPSHNILGCIFTAKALTDSRKNLVKQHYLLHVSSQYGELWPTNGWDRFVSLGHPPQQISTGFACWRRRSTEVNQTLHDVWPTPGLVDYICTFSGAVARNRIRPGAKFTLHPSLALLRGSRAVGVSQTLLHGIFTRQGGHPFRHRAVELSSYYIFNANCKNLNKIYSL